MSSLYKGFPPIRKPFQFIKCSDNGRAFNLLYQGVNNIRLFRPSQWSGRKSGATLRYHFNVVVIMTYYIQQDSSHLSLFNSSSMINVPHYNVTKAKTFIHFQLICRQAEVARPYSMSEVIISYFIWQTLMIPIAFYPFGNGPNGKVQR